MLQKFSPANFVGGGCGIGKEFIDSVRSRGFLGATREQRDPIFGVAGLPCLQKTIGGSEGWDVAGIEIVSRMSFRGQGREQKQLQDKKNQCMLPGAAGRRHYSTQGLAKSH